MYCALCNVKLYLLLSERDWLNHWPDWKMNGPEWIIQQSIYVATLKFDQLVLSALNTLFSDTSSGKDRAMEL